MSDALRRRVAVALLILGAAVAALAIADVGPFSDPPTEEERVADVVEHFFGAASDGDSATFCRLLTSDAREALQVETAQRLHIDEEPRCKRILDALGGIFEGSQVSVRYVSVSGNRARVEARYKLAGAGGEPRTVLLLEERGEWRVSDPG
jgi:HEAT repeat protein